MRPNKLVMKAFGPFLDETVVDFDAMGNNVYLISGETGAGKTTIFDAIVFALYGKASGEGRSKLGAEAFHSDLAKADGVKLPMSVEFTFTNGGNRYKITRTLSWGAKGRNENVKHESVLEELDTDKRPVICTKTMGGSNDEVSARVIEMLGLDSNQFRRIIMLAQGEFRKFLQADSKDRGDILGKLYDNRKHHDLEARISAAVKQLDRKASQFRTKAETLVESMVIPEDMDQEFSQQITPELAEKLNADHFQVIEAAGEVNSVINKQVEQIKLEIDKGRNRIETAREDRSRAENNNSLLNQINKDKELLQGFESRKPEQDEIRTAVQLARSAARVVNIWDNLKKEETQLSQTAAATLKLTAELEEMKSSEEKLKKDSESVNAENSSRIESLNEKSSDLKQQLDKYQQLEDAEKKLSEAEAELKRVSAGQAAAETEYDNNRNKLEEHRQIIETLKDYTESYLQLHRQEAENQKKRMLSLEIIAQDKKTIDGLEADYGEVKLEYEKAALRCRDANERYSFIHTSFINGQASVIADDLRESIRKNGEGVCPVCGTVHKNPECSEFAESGQQVPSREEHDMAFKTLQSAQTVQHDVSVRLAELEADINGRRNALLNEASRVLEDICNDHVSWDKLADGTAVASATQQCRLVIEREESLISEAEEKIKQRVEAENSIKALTESENELQKKIAELEMDKQRCSTELASCRKAAEIIGKQLENYPPTKQAADKLLDEYRLAKEKYSSEISKAAEAYSKCKEQVVTLGTQRADSLRAEEQLKENVGTLEGQLSAALVENGFSSVGEFASARSPEGVPLGSGDLTDWIEAAERKLTEYKEQIVKLKASIDSLTARTQGMEPADLQAIDDRIRDMKANVDELDRRRGSWEAAYAGNRTAIAGLTDIMDKLAGINRAAMVLKPLDMASGRLSFSRYVLFNYFEQIVDRANMKLETLSDGELSLVAKPDVSDGRKSTGLGLTVMDNLTGQERDTATLSGGQSFEASLALALGLSEVVQMHNTSSIEIDSMFIDEGFGSLDDIRLDRAVKVLESLSAGTRQIGIISHVAKLDECLTKKIRVKKQGRASCVTVQSDI